MGGHQKCRSMFFPRIWVLILTLGFILSACSNSALVFGKTNGSPVNTASPQPSIPAPSSDPTPDRKTINLVSAPISTKPVPTISSTPVEDSNPLPCGENWCIYPGHFFFSSPIASPGIDRPEPSYLYGSNQNGNRPPHHGVEFINPIGTPVLAAADGEVAYAGKDEAVVFADRADTYGNLVVLRHTFPGEDQPVYTLYGHLRKILVTEGSLVKCGEEIGEVGESGAAIGAHLHFEVRVGLDDYAHTQNPQLWLMPKVDSSGLLNGAIVGTIIDPSGRLRYYSNVQITPLGDAVHSVNPTYAPRTYADASIPGDQKWNEVFTQANLPSGMYLVSLNHHQIVTFQVEVRPGMVTRVQFTTPD